PRRPDQRPGWHPSTPSPPPAAWPQRTILLVAVEGVRCIDTHSHWMPPTHLAAVRALLDDEPALRRDYGGMLALTERSPSPLLDLDLLIAEMDSSGVDVSAIALPPPAATLGPPATARRVA